MPKAPKIAAFCSCSLPSFGRMCDAMNKGAVTSVSKYIGLCFALASTLGCAIEEHCDDLDTCGGSVMTNGAQDFNNDGPVETEWHASAGDECQDPLHTPPLQNTLITQPPHLANEAPPERSSMDWCSNLVIRGDRTIKRVNLWFPQIPLRDAKLTYSAASDAATDGKYQIQFKYFKQMRADFSAQCMTAQGVVMGCTEFSHAMATVLQTEPNIDSVVCDDGPQGGCTCIYNMLLVTSVSGPWRRDGDLITHYDELGSAPAESDYCVNGNQLDLTGHDRTWVFNETGLRTLQLVRSTCEDGLRNQSEAGVDCGGTCPTACP